MTDNEKQYDRWDLVLFVYSLGGILLSLTASVSLAALGVAALLMRNNPNAQSAQWSAGGMLALALAALPAAVESGRVIFGGKSKAASRPARSWYWLALLFPFGLLLGYLGYERSFLPGLLGPIGQLLAVATPVALIALLLRRSGPLVRPRRIWGHFLAGLFAIPFVTILVEAIFLIFGIGFTALGLAVTPSGQEIIQQLSPYLNTPGMQTPEIPEALLVDIVLNPVIIISLSLFLGLLVPIIEETLKSSSIWPFLPGKVNPGLAFLGGALGGAGFALAEAMFLTQPATGWLVTAVARSGASSMHALASGLAGWGLAQGFVRRDWKKLLLAFATAIGLHGIWNIAAIAVSLSSVSQEMGTGTGLTSAILASGIFIIVGLSLLSIYLLPTLQKRFSAPDEGKESVS